MDDTAAPEAAVVPDPQPEAPTESETAAPEPVVEPAAAPTPKTPPQADDETPGDPTLSEPLKSLDEILKSPDPEPTRPAVAPQTSAPKTATDTAPSADAEPEPKPAAAEAAPTAEPEPAAAVAEPEAKPAPATEPQAEGEPETVEPEPAETVAPETATQTTAEAEPEAEADAQAEPATEEATAAPEAEADAEPAADADAEPEPEPVAAVAEPEAKPAPATEPQAEGEPETVEPESAPEPTAETAAEPEAAADAPAEPDVAPTADAEDDREPAAAATEAAPTAEPGAVAASAAEDGREAKPVNADAAPTADAEDDPAPATAGAPAIAPGDIETRAPGLVGLYTRAAEALEKHSLSGGRAVVYLVLDRSGSMRSYYKDGTVQHLAEQALALSAQLNTTGTVPVVFFSTDIDGTADIALDNYGGRIEELHASLGHMGRTNYHSAVNAVIDHYKESGATDPALVIFQTDGAPTTKTAAEKALCEAAGLPLFWQFIGFGDPEAKGFDFLRKLDASPAFAVPEKRAVDNTGFFHAGLDPRSVSDADLYEELVRKFPGWLEEARAAGVQA
ncbi:VWA domain-containing protein [Streptomyces sp. NPDC005336]|uniref:VWA domain-containing protein n=1 Tax=Streptomyces sp. NPDC005336 TaxID=3157035 RepID=UPI0033ABF510